MLESGMLMQSNVDHGGRMISHIRPSLRCNVAGAAACRMRRVQISVNMQRAHVSSDVLRILGFCTLVSG